jgi:hypothetical protein
LLDPSPLAVEVGLLVVDAKEICALLDSSTAAEILENSKDAWSGGVYATPLPTGELICIINPTHGPYRQKITLMEEIAHIYLEHSPTGLQTVGNGLRLRDFKAKQEREAYGVGSAALLPWAAFFHDFNAGFSVMNLATKYQVSRELIEYRMKTSGAYKLYHARPKSRLKRLLLREEFLLACLRLLRVLRYHHGGPSMRRPCRVKWFGSGSGADASGPRGLSEHRPKEMPAPNSAERSKDLRQIAIKATDEESFTFLQCSSGW